jgi:hypothetical protein
MPSAGNGAEPVENSLLRLISSAQWWRGNNAKINAAANVFCGVISAES